MRPDLPPSLHWDAPTDFQVPCGDLRLRECLQVRAATAARGPTFMQPLKTQIDHSEPCGDPGAHLESAESSPCQVLEGALPCQLPLLPFTSVTASVLASQVVFVYSSKFKWFTYQCV